MTRFFKHLISGCLLILLAACSPEVPSAPLTPDPVQEGQQAVVDPEPTAETMATSAPLPTSTPAPALPLSVEALAGNWLGAVYLDEKPVTLSMNVTVEDGTAIARPRFLGGSTAGTGSAASLTILGSENSFIFDTDFGRNGDFQFTGQMRETGLDGTVVSGGKEGTFYLIPYLQHENLVSLTGLYRFENGQTIDISRSFLETDGGSPGLFLPGMWLVNHSTGAYRALSPVSEDTFYVGPSLGIALPATDIIIFHTDESGQADSLTMQNLTGDRAIQTAIRQDFPTEDIVYLNEGAELAGTLTLPLEGEGPFPAIYLVHGSGRSKRHLVERFGRLFASQGFATLAMDKRGVGESGGSYTESASESRLLLLASDVAAGLDYLRARPEINPDKVGLLGSSQAGWIIPPAAVQSGHAAFTIILSGPVVTVGQEGIYSAFTADGAVEVIKSEEEIAEAVLAAAGRGFDAIPYIIQLEAPALWLFGAKDASIPVAQSVENLQAVIDSEDKTNFSYTVFPNGDHGLWESETGTMSDWPYIQRRVPGYFDVLLEWLESQK